MVWSCECAHVNDAIDLELQLKGWSRAKKRALVEGRFELLPGLARKQFSRDQ